MTHRLPARVQPQIWVKNNAVDAGEVIRFDAHDQMLALDPGTFSEIAADILGGGHNYDELVIGAGLVDGWLSGSDQATFLATVDAEDFEEWLLNLGLNREAASAVTEAQLIEIRTREFEADHFAVVM